MRSFYLTTLAENWGLSRHSDETDDQLRTRITSYAQNPYQNQFLMSKPEEQLNLYDFLPEPLPIEGVDYFLPNMENIQPVSTIDIPKLVKEFFPLINSVEIIAPIDVDGKKEIKQYTEFLNEDEQIKLCRQWTENQLNTAKQYLDIFHHWKTPSPTMRDATIINLKNAVFNFNHIVQEKSEQAQKLDKTNQSVQSSPPGTIHINGEPIKYTGSPSADIAILKDLPITTLPLFDKTNTLLEFQTLPNEAVINAPKGLKIKVGKQELSLDEQAIEDLRTVIRKHYETGISAKEVVELAEKMAVANWIPISAVQEQINIISKWTRTEFENMNRKCNQDLEYKADVIKTTKELAISQGEADDLTAKMVLAGLIPNTAIEFAEQSKAILNWNRRALTSAHKLCDKELQKKENLKKEKEEFFQAFEKANKEYSQAMNMEYQLSSSFNRVARVDKIIDQLIKYQILSNDKEDLTWHRRYIDCWTDQELASIESNLNDLEHLIYMNGANHSTVKEFNNNAANWIGEINRKYRPMIKVVWQSEYEKATQGLHIEEFLDKQLAKELKGFIGKPNNEETVKNLQTAIQNTIQQVLPNSTVQTTQIDNVKLNPDGSMEMRIDIPINAPLETKDAFLNNETNLTPEQIEWEADFCRDVLKNHKASKDIKEYCRKWLLRHNLPIPLIDFSDLHFHPKMEIKPDIVIDLKDKTSSKEQQIDQIPPKSSNFKSELSQAGLRVLTNQTAQITQGFILQALPIEQLPLLQEFFASELGKSFVSLVAGLSLTYGMENNELAQKLAREFRINSMAILGNTAMETLMSAVVSNIQNAFQELPEEEFAGLSEATEHQDIEVDDEQTQLETTIHSV